MEVFKTSIKTSLGKVAIAATGYGVAKVSINQPEEEFEQELRAALQRCCRKGEEDKQQSRANQMANARKYIQMASSFIISLRPPLASTMWRCKTKGARIPQGNCSQTGKRTQPNCNIPLHLMGTSFQMATWLQLQQIEHGTTATYKQIASGICRPKAHRACANAIASNPIAILLPCHRVVMSSGQMGGYRWGRAAKAALLKWENRPTAENINKIRQE